MSQYFPGAYEDSSGNGRFELNLPNCTTKADLKGAKGIVTYTLVSKTNLTSLKTKRDNLNADKLKTFLADLTETSNAVMQWMMINVVKNLFMINWLSKSMLLILRYQVLVD